jgi:type IV pilus assembly protein PilQ
MKSSRKFKTILTASAVALAVFAAAPRSGRYGSSLLADVAPAAPHAGLQAGAVPPQYTGQKISVNLKDVDLKDFFRLIHEISGLNLIVDPNVSGTLTLALDNVPWDQALEIVLKNNGLDKVLEGNVLRIARLDTLRSEAESRQRLAESEEDAAPLVTQVRYLQYASAADVNVNHSSAGSSAGGGVTGLTMIPGVVSILKKMGNTVLSKRGMVAADPRNNAVVITDVASQLPIIDAVIDKLDRKTKQVSIEARIVLTTSDVAHQIQGSLMNFLRNGSGSVATGGATGSGSSAQGTPPAGQSAGPISLYPSSLGTNLPAVLSSAPTGFGAYAISAQAGKYLITAALAAAESKNMAKTISSPSIVTQNNVPGSVMQGTQIPVQTVVNNTVTTVYINATLTLEVTPQVTDDGHIFLNILVENNSPGPLVSATGNPEINTQAATTQVLVPDGGVVVFGGIKVNSNTKSVTQVPGLGSVPILGNLFKSSNRENQENELLFVVAPKILPT